MPITNSDIEERVIKACEWLNAPKKPCFVKAARKYSVYKDCVQCQYLRNALSSENIRGHNKRLNNNEDRTLYAYINFADKLGLLIHEKTLIITINLILLPVN
jgi:hypothetical protein